MMILTVGGAITCYYGGKILEIDDSSEPFVIESCFTHKNKLAQLRVVLPHVHQRVFFYSCFYIYLFIYFIYLFIFNYLFFYLFIHLFILFIYFIYFLFIILYFIHVFIYIYIL